jgi:hypothetical protein
MGNTTNNDPIPSSSSRGSTTGQDSTPKQILITTDKSDGFYFTGESLTGTIEIPISYLQQYLNNKTNRKLTERLRQQSLRNVILLELVGEATYSAEVDAAADSDGHATHQVNVCRQACVVIINQDNERQSMQRNDYNETSFDQTINSTFRASDTQTLTFSLPSTIKGTFQLQIPDDLPASLINNRPPSVEYTLELNLSSSRCRYQIPIILSSKGYVPHLTTDIELNSSAINPHDIHLQAYLSKTFYQPGEKIPVRVNYSNPQQRAIRLIRVTLIQFYRIHNDQYRSQLDGKEWTFDMSSQREWFGETVLQLPYQPLPASFSNQSVGTRQRIECELDYRISIELNEKKGDDIHLILPSINITYQT